MKTLLTGLFLLSINFSALAWNERGNGGDTCESRIQEISKDFEGWFQREEFSAIILPEHVTQDEYKEGMLAAISTSVISCTRDKIFVGRAEKICMNKGSLIKCNADRFKGLTASEQYKLIHHEFAGVSGFEVNKSEASNYQISNQITDFLREGNKLGVHKKDDPKVKSDTRVNNCKRSLRLLVDIYKEYTDVYRSCERAANRSIYNKFSTLARELEGMASKASDLCYQDCDDTDYCDVSEITGACR